MSPILQRSIRVAIGVLFGLLLLRQMTLVVCSDSAHVLEVILVILGWVLLRILFQYLNDFPATLRKSAIQEITRPSLGQDRSTSTGGMFRRFRQIRSVLPFVANAFA